MGLEAPLMEMVCPTWKPLAADVTAVATSPETVREESETVVGAIPAPPPLMVHWLTTEPVERVVELVAQPGFPGSLISVSVQAAGSEVVGFPMMIPRPLTP